MVKRLGRAIAFLLSLLAIIIGSIDISASLNAKTLIFTDGWSIIYFIMSKQPEALGWQINNSQALLHLPLALTFAILSVALYRLLPIKNKARFATQF